MRPKRLLAPFALVIFLLCSAAPAAAFDWPVEALDYEFRPPERGIAVGDTVTWSFLNAGHTATAVSGQAESWDSGPTNAGATFSHTFTRPGRFQYICVPHQNFDMKGVITVGTDTVPDSLERFRSKRRGNRVRLSFVLTEPAKVTYKLRGPSRRTVKRARLDDGARSFTLRRLRRGTYRGVLTAIDDFDKKVTARNFFVIR
jgi:plastocyanin